ncbi:hypothetical protein CRENBAI_007511 [Crenichthys baileyi]|uniref:Secreted protein n=1 Tax=Crenichthys baileyi TaxID=28760 RepID=A0AAV9QTF3_9TELE
MVGRAWWCAAPVAVILSCLEIGVAGWRVECRGCSVWGGGGSVLFFWMCGHRHLGQLSGDGGAKMGGVFLWAAVAVCLPLAGDLLPGRDWGGVAWGPCLAIAPRCVVECRMRPGCLEWGRYV